ncbi:MAG: putative isochorismatase [Hyphomicrobiales bacterium]|nr:putative isochorismatase [Hyphomicrobiales bacterium]
MNDRPQALSIRTAAAPRTGVLAANPAPLDVDFSRAALIVVDMQNDFIHPQGWFPASGVDVSPLRAVAPAIRDLSDAMREAGVPVIWLNWGVRPDAGDMPDTIKRKGGLNGKRPTYGDPSPSGDGRILVQGEWGARNIDELTPDPADLIVHKNRLTGFYDNALDSLLRNRGVETLFFAGVNIDRCVFATLSDAAVRGYSCVLVEDACATCSPAYVRDAILFLVPLLHGACATSAAVTAALAPVTAKKD